MSRIANSKEDASNFRIINIRAQGAGWQSRGIGGGALFAPAISPHNNNLVYMATDMSRVFKSGDFGRNWTTLDFRQTQGGKKTCKEKRHDFHLR